MGGVRSTTRQMSRGALHRYGALFWYPKIDNVVPTDRRNNADDVRPGTDRQTKDIFRSVTDSRFVITGLDYGFE